MSANSTVVIGKEIYTVEWNSGAARLYTPEVELREQCSNVITMCRLGNELSTIYYIFNLCADN